MVLLLVEGVGLAVISGIPLEQSIQLLMVVRHGMVV
jgi:hypothetical protein